MEVVAGSYQELILGYRLVKGQNGYQFEQSFTDHSHIGSVRAISVSPRGILASGSADETIRLFSLKSRLEMGSLMHHEGTVTDVHFFKKSHMFTSSEDGTIGVWKTGSWECVRTLKGHKGAVNSISVHPSGKLALSVGKDRSLRTWNLITGRKAYITNIKQAADLVRWSSSGERYVVIFGNKIDIYDVETCTVIRTIDVPFKVCCAEFITGDHLAVGGEGEDLYMYNINSGDLEHEIKTETVRVKGIVVCSCPEVAEEGLLLTCVSSDGHIKVWNLLQKEDAWTSELIASVDTKFRLTCVAVMSTQPAVKVPKSEPKEEEEEVMPAGDESDIKVEENIQEADKKIKKKKKKKPKEKSNDSDDIQEIDTPESSPKKNKRKSEDIDTPESSPKKNKRKSEDIDNETNVKVQKLTHKTGTKTKKVKKNKKMGLK